MKEIIETNKFIFITGTDTGVGKSIFTATLALSYLHEGKKVVISKPIQSGDPDISLLAILTENKVPIFNTYSFDLPAAPIVAARAEDKSIEIEKVVNDIRQLEKRFDCVLVEGVGGIAVPITQNVIARNGVTKQSHNGIGLLRRCFVPPRNDTYLVADLIKDLNYPVIIVARPALGTINHTILTIEFAKQKGLNILGFVISGYDEKTNDPVIKTAPDVISEITGVNYLMEIPFICEINYESINLIARSRTSILT